MTDEEAMEFSVPADSHTPGIVCQKCGQNLEENRDLECKGGDA